MINFAYKTWGWWALAHHLLTDFYVQSVLLIIVCIHIYGVH